MSDDQRNSTMLFILSGIQNSIKTVDEKIDDRWDKALADLSVQREKLEKLEKEVEHTTKILTTGNGKPSIVTQVFKLQNDVDDVKETSRKTLEEIGKVHKAMHLPIPPQVRVERWKTAGLIVSLLITIASTLAVIYT